MTHQWTRGTTLDERLEVIPVKGVKGTISLAQAKYMVPGPNCMLKSLWE